jgi:anti-sigma-K factor RskA
LNQMVGAVEPRPELWGRIKAAIGETGPHSPIEVPETHRPVAAEAPRGEPAASVVPVIDDSSVILLSLQARRWRNVAVAMTALAAALVAMLSAQVYRPDLLPGGLRPKPRTQVVEVKTPVPTSAAQFVALLQKDSASPAFILTVDAATKNFTVRRVGATPEPGKSYELWIVSDRLQRPRSLGVIGGNDFTARPALAAYDADTVNRATYAVSVEPEGGSPTDVPTGPVVFTGKLIETVPPGTPQGR